MEPRWGHFFAAWCRYALQMRRGIKSRKLNNQLCAFFNLHCGLQFIQLPKRCRTQHFTLQETKCWCHFVFLLACFLMFFLCSLFRMLRLAFLPELENLILSLQLLSIYIGYQSNIALSLKSCYSLLKSWITLRPATSLTSSICTLLVVH